MWVTAARHTVIQRVAGACVGASEACFSQIGRRCGLCVLPNHFSAVSLVSRLEHRMDVVNGFWLALLTLAVSQPPGAVGSQDGPWSTVFKEKEPYQVMG